MSRLIDYFLLFSCLFGLFSARECSNWILATSSNLESCSDHSAGSYRYMYRQSALRYYLSPTTSDKWSWSTYQEITGDYDYTIDGETFHSFNCEGGEDGDYGIGCSNGPGNTYKVLPMKYNNDFTPNAGLAQICQDKPGIFSDDPGDHPCQTEIDIYYRYCTKDITAFKVCMGYEDGELGPDLGPIKYNQYKDEIIMALLLMNVILIIGYCWCVYSKRNNKKQYKIVNIESDDSELDGLNKM